MRTRGQRGREMTHVNVVVFDDGRRCPDPRFGQRKRTLVRNLLRLAGNARTRCRAKPQLNVESAGDDPHDLILGGVRQLFPRAHGRGIRNERSIQALDPRLEEQLREQKPMLVHKHTKHVVIAENANLDAGWSHEHVEVPVAVTTKQHCVFVVALRIQGHWLCERRVCANGIAQSKGNTPTTRHNTLRASIRSALWTRECASFGTAVHVVRKRTVATALGRVRPAGFWFGCHV